MNGLDQQGPSNNAQPAEPNYIPLSTKPRQMPGGSGGEQMDPEAGTGEESKSGPGEDAGSSETKNETPPPGGAGTTGGTA